MNLETIFKKNASKTSHCFSYIHLKALRFIAEITPNSKGLRPFPQIRMRFATGFKLKKHEVWILLRELESLGLIKLYRFNGVKISPFGWNILRMEEKE